VVAQFDYGDGEQPISGNQDFSVFVTNDFIVEGGGGDFVITAGGGTLGRRDLGRPLLVDRLPGHGRSRHRWRRPQRLAHHRLASQDLEQPAHRWSARPGTAQYFELVKRTFASLESRAV
jgi:hypothetical protein